MRDRRARRAASWAVAASVALATVGVAALAQDRPRGADPAPAAKGGKAKAKPRKGGLRIPAGPARKLQKDAGDPLDPAAGPAGRGALAPAWPFHYKFRLITDDGTAMNATYYPARIGPTSPAILLVHERGGLAKDFQDPIDDLKGLGLAEALQGQGYAVLLVDFRGPPPRNPGQNANANANANANQAAEDREAASAIGWRGRAEDLQSAYQFLVDRHNRGELNLAKFGVVALGDGANLAARWAQLPGGATSSEGRISDLGALVLVSPAAGLPGRGPRLEATLAALAPRVPLLMMAGEKDAASREVVKVARPIVERQRLNKVVTYPTKLHGAQFVRFTAQVPATIQKFLDGAIKYRRDEWEPRYNLTPVAYSDALLVLPKDRKPPAAAKAAADPAPPAAAAPAPKANPPGRKKAAN